MRSVDTRDGREGATIAGEAVETAEAVSSGKSPPVREGSVKGSAKGPAGEPAGGPGGGAGSTPGHGTRSRWVPSILAAATLVLALGAPPAVTPAEAQADAEPAPAGTAGTARHRGYPAVPIEAVRSRLGGARPIEPLPGSPFVRVDGRLVQLANPSYLRGETLWIPAEVLSILRVSDGRSGERSETGSGGPQSGSDPEGVAGPAAGPGSGSAPSPSPDAARSEGPWTVVLDPGHGGRDPGTRGPRGTREKDVVLSIARKVREKLEDDGRVRARLTRESDRFLPLEERSRMAVRRGGDLFISIHANASPSRSARGFETYFLGEARTEEAKRVAMRENASIRFEPGSGERVDARVQYILASNDLNAWRRESMYLAGHLQNHLRRRRDAPDRGVKQNIFYVLMGASGSMPAVLAEVGFLSNPTEERELAAEAGQDRIAEALADAIVAYFEDRAAGRVAGLGS